MKEAAIVVRIYSFKNKEKKYKKSLINMLKILNYWKIFNCSTEEESKQKLTTSELYGINYEIDVLMGSVSQVYVCIY